jgi:dihydroorotase
MKILIKSAEILDPGNTFHRKKKNILIEDGVIRFISDKDHKADEVIDAAGLKLSAGWFDMRCAIRDPGFEHKEDINSVSIAAAAGGFTGIACLPNTNPVIQTKDVISYIKSKSADTILDIFPIAALTLGNKGEELTEMIDLHHGGAVAFSDGNKPVWHSDVLYKALQYIQSFEGLLIEHAEDKYLSGGGQMNEGKVSTTLGLKGLPKISEELIVERDLKILEYSGAGRIHFSHVSSPKSLEMIRSAKKKGLNVTCDVAVYQLVFDDSQLTGFDTNLKVNPPVRSKEDLKYFWKAIEDDTIDVIVTDHNPQDEESKNTEFDQAEFGMIGLETAFAAFNTFNKDLKLEKYIEKVTVSPREILKLYSPKIEEGEPANLTLFDPNKEWMYSKENIRSKSKNSPFIGKKLKGKVVAVFNKNKYLFNV